MSHSTRIRFLDRRDIRAIVLLMAWLAVSFGPFVVHFGHEHSHFLAVLPHGTWGIADNDQLGPCPVCSGWSSVSAPTPSPPLMTYLLFAEEEAIVLAERAAASTERLGSISPRGPPHPSFA